MKLFFKKTIDGLSKTRKKLNDIILNFSGKSILDSEDLEKLEEQLLTADLGWELTDLILESLKEADLKQYSVEHRFKKCINDYINISNNLTDLNKVVIIVGVNGTGKTTSIAKLGHYFSNLGKSVTLVGADTYRAAAIEQIRLWADRLNLNFITNEKSTDPASIAYDGVSSGITKKFDQIIIDTSGRIQNSINLMKELEKIYRVVSNLTSDIDVLMTIDANTGQNGMHQIKEFSKFIPVSGIILTKMDGTAKGGIAVQIMKELQLPIYFMGVGEDMEDLIPFDLSNYINGLISTKDAVYEN